MRKNNLVKCLTILGLTYGAIAHAHGEMLLVEGRFFEGGIRTFQYTVNNERHYVCTGGSQYCPSSMYISIEPNKDNIFDLYNYDPVSANYTISDSCRKQVINVKPNTGRTIKIVKIKQEIVCS